MTLSKVAKRGFSAVAIIGLLSFGACSIAMPGPVFTNGESYQGNPGTKDIVAHASFEMLFGVIGLNETGEDKARNEIRESLTSQCQGGRLENLSFAATVRNYIVYIESTLTEHATCVMPKSS